MSALRLRYSDGLGIEIRVDDETPQSDDPITIAMWTGGFAHLSIEQAEKVRDALTRAIDDAKHWKTP